MKYVDAAKAADKIKEAFNISLCDLVDVFVEIPAEDVQPVKKCRMIPQNPDCRGNTDIFMCTNCKSYIDLGFISKDYVGKFCLECGAEVEDEP
jgi:hypothetical protein